MAIPAPLGIKVPHTGWSRIRPRPHESWAGSLLEDIPSGSRFYFVHSYCVEPDEDGHRLAETQYGGLRISAAIQHEHIVGCQFHPEKSGPLGLKILSNFLRT